MSNLRIFIFPHDDPQKTIGIVRTTKLEIKENEVWAYFTIDQLKDMVDKCHAKIAEFMD